MADLMNNDLLHYEAVKAQRAKSLKLLALAKKVEALKIRHGYTYQQIDDKTWKLKKPSPPAKKSNS